MNCRKCNKELTEKHRIIEKADMVYTDPPYGFGYDSDFYQSLNGDAQHTGSGKVCGPRKKKQYKPLEGDDGEFNYDPSFILEYFRECKDIFLWGADYYCQSLPKHGSWICWNKIAGNDKFDNIPGASFELCWSKDKHKRHLAPITWRACFGHNKKNDGAEKMHPTQKPIALHDWFFARFGKDKTNIVDLYGGSGSTLIACEKTNRKCKLLEIDPQYCQVIIDRWEKFTGLKAKQITT